MLDYMDRDLNNADTVAMGDGSVEIRFRRIASQFEQDHQALVARIDRLTLFVKS